MEDNGGRVECVKAEDIGGRMEDDSGGRVEEGRFGSLMKKFLICYGLISASVTKQGQDKQTFKKS